MITKGKGGGYLVVAGGGDVCVTLSLLMCVPCHASELENPWPKTLEHCSVLFFFLINNKILFSDVLLKKKKKKDLKKTKNFSPIIYGYVCICLYNTQQFLIYSCSPPHPQPWAHHSMMVCKALWVVCVLFLQKLIFEPEQEWVCDGL